MEKDLKTTAKIIFRNIGFNLVGKMIPLLIGVFSLPFVISGLGMEQFGILSIIWMALLTYFNFFDFGLGEAVIKFIAEFLGREEERLPKIFWTSLVFAFLLGLLGTIIILLITPFFVNKVLNISPDLIDIVERSFFILAFAVPFVTVLSIGKGVLAGIQRYDIINFIKIPLNSLFFLIPVFCLLFGLGLPEIVFFLVLSYGLGALVYLLFCFKILPVIRRFSFPKFKNSLYLFAFGKWLTISKVLSTFLTHIDRFLIGSFISVAVIGFYTVPLDTVARTLILAESLRVLFPVFSSFSRERREQAGFFYLRSLKHLLVIMGGVMIVVVLLAPDMLFLWLGEEFREKSTFVLQLLAIGVFAHSFSLLGANLIKGFGRPDILAKLRLVEVPFTVFFLWFFIKNIGISGAALVWMSRALIDSLIITLICFKFLSLKLSVLKRNRFDRILIFLLLFGLLILAGKIFLTVPIFLGFLMVVLISFIFIWKYYIMDYKDIELIKSIFIFKK